MNNQNKQKSKDRQKTFEDDGYVYYLDSGAGFTGVCIHPTSNCTHSLQFFVHQLYLNKAVFKRDTVHPFI